MKYFEFVGMPGSGKSAVSAALVNKLKLTCGRRYLSIEEAFYLVSKGRIDRCFRWPFYVLPRQLALRFASKLQNRSIFQFDAQNRFIAKYGNALKVYLMSEGYSNASLVDRKNSIEFFLDTGSNYSIVSDGLDEKCVVLFSEGFVQKSSMFLSSRATSISMPLMDEYLSNIPCPDLLFYVNADPESCADRMLSRPRGLPLRMRGFEDGDVLNYLRRVDSHLKGAVEYLKCNYGLEVIEIDNSDTLEKSIEQAFLGIGNHRA